MLDARNIKYQDRPIQNEVEDSLDRGPFVESLVRALLREERDSDGIASVSATGYVVGLVGKWGLGKSSILHLLQQKLRKTPRVAVVLFNPWLFKGRDELLRAFFNSLREALGRSNIEKAQVLTNAVDKYWSAIEWMGKAGAAYGDVYGGGGILSAIWKWISSLGRSLIRKTQIRSVDTEREALEAKLAKHKAAVVVLIDELDRVEDDEVRAVAQLVKALGDIKGISYLVAYDQNRVVDALGRGATPKERAKSGAAYLEKIIQHPIPLRPLFSHDVDALLAASLADHGLNFDGLNDDASKALFEQIKLEITTPREVKRLVGSYAVLEEVVRGEIHPLDVLAYCWLLTKAPGLRDAIAAELDKVVDDPTQAEMMARIAETDMERKKSPDAAEILGEMASDNAKLLGLLFPRFGDQRRREDGTRLSFRRNLVRLLYLGNPPGMIRRKDIESLWSETNAALVAERVERLFARDEIRAFVDRLDDLLPQLSTKGDTRFWPALIPHLKRPEDWVQGSDERDSIAGEVSDVLMRLATRNPEEAGRLNDILDTLIEAGDFSLVPRILRKQMFAYGLTRRGNDTRGGGALTKEQTEALLDREIPRYRAAFLGGDFLKRCINVEPMYVLGNRGLWDEERRQALTVQLEDPAAIESLSTMVVPPGFIADRDSMNEFFDADVVLARIEATTTTKGWPTNVWIARSLRNMRGTLRGLNPRDDGW